MSISETLATLWGDKNMLGGADSSSIMPGEWDWMQDIGNMNGMQTMQPQMPQQPQQPQQPPMPQLPQTQSSFDPSYQEMQQPYMPNRPSPFGLLMEDDNEQRMKAQFGGLL
jgi:hypothetical protein